MRKPESLLLQWICEETIEQLGIQVLSYHNTAFQQLLKPLFETSWPNSIILACFTDCRQIFCAKTEQIDAWTDPQAPVLSLKLLHQLAHVERCEIQGGRDRFVMAWLRHLPEDVIIALEQGDPIDTERIHFAMFMESQANNRAESICHRLRCEKD